MSASSFCLMKKVMIGFFVLPFTFATYAESNRGVDQYYDYAFKLQQKGLYIQADAVLTAGINKFPQARKLFYARGNLRNEYLRQYIFAAKDYTAVINLDLKNSPKALWRRGDCFYALGKYQHSIVDYTQSLKLIPSYDKVYIKRAKAYAKLGMIDKAKSDLKSAIKYGPEWEPQARALLEKILSGNNDY
jgi:tetratricopeptide (TPR) repeat protein